MSSKLLALLLIAIFCTSPLPLHPRTFSSSAKITGRVVDAKTQQPLAHVEVYVKTSPRGDVTDEQGHYQIVNLPAGTYEIIFRRQGYKTGHQKEISVRANATLEVNAQMTPAPIELDEVLVTAHRRADIEAEVSQLISIIKTAGAIPFLTWPQ